MIHYLEDDELWFPAAREARMDGLLMIGGNLSPERLLLAYSRGIFPWFEEQNIPFWFSPDPRLVLFPEEIKISKSMKQVMRNGEFEVTFNKQFETVINECAAVSRKDQPGTWISKSFISSYTELHKQGFAHSVEVWKGGQIVGGLYGVATNNVFSGESMFSKVPNTSKLALIWLCQSNKFRVIDCQVGTDHLQNMGAKHISREHFLNLL